MNNTTLKFSGFISLLSVFFLLELVVGIMYNSLILQADALHMLTDIIATSIAFACQELSIREKTTQLTYGWSRMKTIGGLCNSIFMLSTCLFLFIESITRLTIDSHTPDIHNYTLLFITVSLGLLVNIIGLMCFHSHDNDEPDHNHTAMFFHIIGDFIGSILALANSLIWFFVDDDRKYITDPIFTFILVAFLFANAVPLLRKCITILLHHTSIDTTSILNSLHNIPGVLDVHDFHVWNLTPSIHIATLHVVRDSKRNQLKRNIESLFHSHGIHSTTIQYEMYIDTVDCSNIICQNSNCQYLKCCN